MKKLIVTLSVALLATAAFAQNPQPVKQAPVAPQVATPQQPVTAPVKNADESMKFVVEDHDFGTVPEGPSVSFDYEFKNICKEPITLTNVQASCGCTIPTWSRDPILPKKTSKITATFSTQGRPGPFTKQITVTSNVGTKVIKFHGTVEPAPKNSVPANDNSIMKH